MNSHALELTVYQAFTLSLQQLLADFLIPTLTCDIYPAHLFLWCLLPTFASGPRGVLRFRMGTDVRPGIPTTTL